MQQLLQMPGAGPMKSALAQQNLKLHAEIGVLENEVQSMSSAMQRLMSSPGGEQVLALHHHI
jgi:nucleoside-triphosphatase THEP1